MKGLVTGSGFGEHVSQRGDPDKQEFSQTQTDPDRGSAEGYRERETQHGSGRSDREGMIKVGGTGR